MAGAASRKGRPPCYSDILYVAFLMCLLGNSEFKSHAPRGGVAKLTLQLQEVDLSVTETVTSAMLSNYRRQINAGRLPNMSNETSAFFLQMYYNDHTEGPEFGVSSEERNQERDEAKEEEATEEEKSMDGGAIRDEEEETTEEEKSMDGGAIHDEEEQTERATSADDQTEMEGRAEEVVDDGMEATAEDMEENEQEEGNASGMGDGGRVVMRNEGGGDDEVVEEGDGEEHPQQGGEEREEEGIPQWMVFLSKALDIASQFNDLLK